MRRSEGGQVAPTAGAPLRLVCIDVDGTLIGSNGAVHPDIWTAATRAREAGLRLAICSGRPAFGIARAHAERLDGDGWHSFQNGASVLNVRTGESRSSQLDASTVAMLLERARRSGRVLEVYTDHDFAVEGESERIQAHSELLGVPFRVRPFSLLSPPFVRAQWMLSHEEAVVALAEWHPGLEVSPSTSPVMPDTTFINLTPPGVTKATAVRTLALIYGITLDQVMFVGDGGNDAPALQLVGHPVAMANAAPEALSFATHIVRHVDDAGLADALDLAVSLSRSPLSTPLP